MSKNKLKWFAEKREVKDLSVWDKNPRMINKKSLTRLKEKIIANGFHDVIVIDTDNTILSGSQRKKILEELNVKKVTVLRPNRPLTEEERNKIVLESNIHEGEWNMEALKSFDLNLLTDIGFDQMELIKFWDEENNALNDNFDVEKTLKSIRKPETKRGDLIILGDHKLLCADSTDPEAVKALFGKDRTSMIYSDSPFNIGLSYDRGVGNKSHYGGEVDDNKTPEEYKSFIKKILVNSLSVSTDDVHCFQWCDEAWVWVFQTLFNELGIKNRRLNIWLKNNSSPTPSVPFNKAIEVCCYGTKGRPFISGLVNNLNEIMNKEMTSGNELYEEVTNVWAVKRLAGNKYEHPTSKPPELHEKAIKKCSNIGDIIFDSFSGSASTMICAEQLKRRVYSLEISEVFCDLAIRRWEKLTGRKVKIIHNFYEKK
ncbi:MAG: DNA modification methylase [Candidatus Taylorbacteria bacterium]|nr:DNA modification methylase [Candidatus Taylorbacteria bacterium]